MMQIYNKIRKDYNAELIACNRNQKRLENVFKTAIENMTPSKETVTINKRT